MENVLEERSSLSLIELFLLQLHKKGGNTVFLKVSLSSVPTLLRHYYAPYHFLLPVPCTGVEHEFMVQSRGGYFSIVTATLEHSKRYVFQADVAVAISD